MICFIRRYIYLFVLISLIMGVFFLQPVLVFSDTFDSNVSVTLYECYDGIDNDSDGLIDYPNDLGCTQYGDDDETDPISCGDGTCNGGESCATCSADCGVCPSGGGGGGGSSRFVTPTTGVIFSGRAYPLSRVTVLKDGQIAITSVAGPDANFKISLTGLSSGNYTFSVYGEDHASRRSALFTFPIFITQGATTNVSGIFIAPTLDIDKSEVRRGDSVAIFGQSTPGSEITISVHSDTEFFKKILADSDGVYLYNLDTSSLETGQHIAKSKSTFGGEISSFGTAVSFLVGTKNIAKKFTKKFLKGDLNDDGRVNLVDFSIVAFWYKRPIRAQFAQKEIERLNNDGQINLVDFSIMAFYWTG